MEDYGEFVQRRLSQLRKSKEDEEEQDRSSSASSAIRFYGRCILPPLLSEKQREEMRRHRDAVQRPAGHRKLKDDPRMTYIQTLLHSVQLRKTPTLEELLQESENKTKSSHQPTSSSCSEVFNGAKDSPPPTPAETSQNGLPPPPLPPSPPPPMTSTTYSAFFASGLSPQHRYHEGCLTDQSGSQPCSFSHPSASSGYVTFDPSATCGEAHSPCPSVDGFYLHSVPQTVTRMPDIISHPPMDGAELERSGMESPFCESPTGVTDVFGVSFQDDSVMSDQQDKDESLNLTILNSAEQENVDADEGSVSAFSGKSDFSDNPQLSQKLGSPYSKMSDQKNPDEPEPVEETDPNTAEELYPLSLQALLKKSQEYRRRQRMLRSQSRASRAQRGGGSLSDKENEDFRHGDAGTREDILTRKSWEVQGPPEGRVPSKSANLNTENGHFPEDRRKEEDETLQNNKRNSSQEPGPGGASIQGQLSGGRSEEGGKHRTVPALSFCRSPVPCKGKGIPKQEEAPGGEKPSEEAAKAKLRPLNGHQPPPPHPVNGLLGNSSQHLDELESHLSGLKVLITDLESTVKENLDDGWQREPGPKGPGIPDPTDFYSFLLGKERARRHPLVNLDNIQKDLGPEEAPTDQEREAERLQLNGGKQMKSSAPEGGKLKEGKGSRRIQPPVRSFLSAAQQMRIPDFFRVIPPENGVCPEERRGEKSSAPSPSLNRSYDVKRRLVMQAGESPERNPDMIRPSSSTPKARWCDGPEVQTDQSERLQQAHAAQIRALQTEHHKQQQDLLQVRTSQREAERETWGSKTSGRAEGRWCDGPEVQTDQSERLQQVHAAQIRALQTEHQKQQQDLLQALAAHYSRLRGLSLFSCSGPGETLTFSQVSHVQQAVLCAVGSPSCCSEPVAILCKTCTPMVMILAVIVHSEPNNLRPSFPLTDERGLEEEGRHPSRSAPVPAV
ncbi:unnamed protein product [Menidia menidia]|uniref:(Atlantic silverside) hypothetical protein n=1 Tax=Menidia menidia TaxID=238744 RepID=A0A8S4B937_9TELE|nr:unnamed protein product [Menidia menidia]